MHFGLADHGAMVDVFSREQRSRIMARVGGKNTTPEKLVRSLLHRMGYRFRLHVSSLPGCPDIVLPKHRKVVFVNGCFWHGHTRCHKGRKRPASNSAFWERKITTTVRRDKDVRSRLRRLGWKVSTIWECELKNPAKVKSKLRRFLTS